MDVELQILKHLARDIHPTVAVDKYRAEYKELFKEVRNYGSSGIFMVTREIY
ncbi:hypothetical protein [Umezakia ovalisporum]|jgi:hypothetical protein|uniref:Uncharacterized protein n=1 Tax=Umezakia ovalisporum FSS-43 TaxID=2740520 RepID=A0ABT6K8Q7_9CYAN|nr:hypothetical protein [Umezakia ovalisporum]MDH6058689.1 hypothetical protein [Umezakia ovalisporum FSS-43]MDH6067219.1 hypothetical protein [Umezakia ovalisporum APH033B]MDH6070748.1 hypothetical protein [Umezakia ovalisporum CobakiLakeA]MDH6078683.1 hypothetical protein [Umezakia ovalisporum FSS-45]MDH6080455.1 hypothetical protein [Umezakia ovalisporum FSS-44]